MGDFLGQHGRHVIGARPHALSDLTPPPQSRPQPHRHVLLFIGVQPGRGLHLALWDHRSGFHVCVYLVAGPVEKSRIDEHDPIRSLG